VSRVRVLVIPGRGQGHGTAPAHSKLAAAQQLDLQSYRRESLEDKPPTPGLELVAPGLHHWQSFQPLASEGRLCTFGLADRSVHRQKPEVTVESLPEALKFAARAKLGMVLRAASPHPFSTSPSTPKSEIRGRRPRLSPRLVQQDAALDLQWVEPEAPDVPGLLAV